MWSAAVFAYLLVAAYMFGRFEVEDYYRGRNGTPRGIAFNLMLAICWPVTLVISAI